VTDGADRRDTVSRFSEGLAVARDDTPEGEEDTRLLSVEELPVFTRLLVETDLRETAFPVAWGVLTADFSVILAADALSLPVTVPRDT